MSAVAVCDMLGFSAEMRKAHEDGLADELLGKLKATLDSWYDAIRDNRGGLDGRRFWELKAFTDNIVLGKPVLPRAEEQTLSFIVSAAAVLQRGLCLEGGFFVRGGVSFGDLYVDDAIVYGTSLLDAHDTQEHVATVPRIVLHQSAADLIPDHARRYASMHRSPQSRLLLQDEDDQLFVNYLAEVWCEDEGGPEYYWLSRHRELVQANLERYSSHAKIFSKYVWAARYHNYICNDVPGAAKYRVAIDSGPLNAKKICDIVSRYEE